MSLQAGKSALTVKMMSKLLLIGSKFDPEMKLQPSALLKNENTQHAVRTRRPCLIFRPRNVIFSYSDIPYSDYLDRCTFF